MKRTLETALVVLCSTLLTPCSTFSAERTYYVAPDGSDRGAGTRGAPFATLARARDAIRALGEEHRRQDIAVVLRGGTYVLDETFVLGLADGGRGGHTVRYEAHPGEKPVLSSGRQIRGWTRLNDPPASLPAKARGKVWVADVKAFGTFRTLFDGDRMLPRARSKGFTQTNQTPRGTKSDSRTVQFPPGAVGPYADLHAAELRIVPCFFWIMNLLPIESIDPETRTLRTKVPGTYPLGRNAITDRPTAWIENVLEELDEPGEWVLDPRAGRLYLWPRGDRPGQNIVAPALTELVRVEGKIDHDGPTDTPAVGLAFRGLTFAHGDSLPFHGQTGWGLQHDWECFDKPTALLRFRGAERCAVEDCEFRSSGHTAVRLDLHARDIRVVGNHIHHVGGVGVLLAGYGPGTKDVNRCNTVANNHIHHVGLQYWASAAVFAWQSGENRIVHNLIHHVPYTAILSTGRISRAGPGPGECSRTVRWHEVPEAFRTWPWVKREPYLHARKNLIAHNDIHNAMQLLGDGNCIYVSGAGGGTVVRGNYCHDCLGKYMNAVIRCDDDQHATRIEQNLCARTAGHGEGFISKGDNDILNNVVADLRPNHRHRGYIVFPYGDITGSRIEGNILYSRRKGQTPYYFGRASKRRPKAPELKTARMDRNVYWCTAEANWAEKHLADARKLGLEKRSLAADPMLADPDKGDFTLREGSPARTLGIAPLDANEAGLEGPYRNRLVGREITTVIRPAGGVLREPTRIEVSCDLPGAVVCYTLDGSEPTRASSRYGGPFTLNRPATVRARAFSADGTDWDGAAVQFAAPPQPIVQDFERVGVGQRVPETETVEDAKHRQYTARVTEEHAAGGKRSLKLIDGPGQEHIFTPHVFYRCRFTEGRVVGRFAVRIDKDTRFRYQWRHYEDGYRSGPTVDIHPGGRVVHEGRGRRELLTLPVGQWVRFTVSCTLGEKAPKTFDLTVALPGRDDPKTFPALPCDDGFQRLDWVGLICNGPRATVVYVDDIEIRPVTPSGRTRR